MSSSLKQIANSAGTCRIVLLLFVILGVIADVVHTCEQGGVDFRNRLVGARLMLAGEDPYWYKWTLGDPLRWLDPVDPPQMPMNRNTVTPACLTVCAPLAPLGYMQARIVWLLVQWAAYAGLAALLVTSVGPGQDRRLVLILVLLAFIGEAWRAHVERGQIYVLYALLLAISYRITRAGHQTWGGLVLGLLVVLRPTLLLTVVPFALSRRWWFVAATVVGAVAGVLGCFVLADTDDWRSYFRAVDTTCTAYMAGENLDLPAATPHATIPATIEGWSHLSRSIRFGDPQSGFAPIVRFFGVPQGKLVMQLAMLIYVRLAAVCIYRCWKPPVSPGKTFFIGVVVALSAELFMPIRRGGYANVVWLVPTGILIAEVGVSRIFSSRLVWLLMVGLCLALGLVPVARGDYLGISDTMILVYFAVVAVQLAQGRRMPA